MLTGVWHLQQRASCSINPLCCTLGCSASLSNSTLLCPVLHSHFVVSTTCTIVLDRSRLLIHNRCTIRNNNGSYARVRVFGGWVISVYRRASPGAGEQSWKAAPLDDSLSLAAKHQRIILASLLLAMPTCASPILGVHSSTWGGWFMPCGLTCHFLVVVAFVSWYSPFLEGPPAAHRIMRSIWLG